MKKSFLFTIIAIAVLSLVQVVQVMAFEINARDKVITQEVGLEDERVPHYAQAENILVAPIFLPVGVSINSAEWIRGLQYYSVVRLGFTDIPFHYIVTPQGQVYKTNKYSDEFNVDIIEGPSNPIVIGYLANSNDTDFNPNAKGSMRALLLNIANTNNIEVDHISISTLRFKLDNENKTSTLEAKTIVGAWNQTIKSDKEYVAGNYAPIPRNYKVSVTSAKVPTAEVEPGNVAIIELTVKNIGENIIFGNGDSNLLVTKQDGKLSSFFLNSVWASQSQVVLMPENESIEPGAEKTFQIKFNVPLYFGEQTEEFELRTESGQKIVGTSFAITLKVSKIDQDVAEILETDIGYLNVRASASGSSEVTGRVSPGERYIVKSRSDVGYIQLDLGEGETGWVFQKYIKFVN